MSIEFSQQSITIKTDTRVRIWGWSYNLEAGQGANNSSP